MCDFLRDTEESVSSGAALVAFFSDHRGDTSIRILADLGVERDVTQEVNSQSLAFSNHTPIRLMIMIMMTMLPSREDFSLLPTMRTREECHVPHHAQHGDIHPLEHPVSSDGIS